MKTLKIAGISAFVGTVSAVVFLVVTGWLIARSGDPEAYYPACAWGSALLSGIAAGAVCFLKNAAGVGTTLLSGVFNCVFPLILSFFFSDGKPFYQSALRLSAILLLPTAVCLLLRAVRAGASEKKRKRKRGRTRAKRRA